MALETLGCRTELVCFLSEAKGSGNNQLGFCFQWEREQGSFLSTSFLALFTIW